MGPKNISLILSDAPTKDMSVMDRMCLKLEAICLEADKNPSVLFQEASKYVENQMSTVGNNMRKLCAEIIRDLLPPSPLNAPDAAEADISVPDKAVKVLEKEFQQHKQVQQGSTLQQQPVDCEVNGKIILTSTLENESSNGFKAGVNKAKLSDMETSRPIKVADFSSKIQQAVEKETAKLDVPDRCKAENLSDMSKELDRNVSALSDDMSSWSNQRSRLYLPEINEDMEQDAYWYVGSEYREALMQRISETTSSLRDIEDQKSARGFDEPDLDWELL
ncbi:hypothetical protein O6H91_06G129500 [Diphasiastrum complanatum]|uniref:Uncharacterized protein n=1 Tax=Diphasiastrum complanatum TaxID=34168 RepID=A0ACC2DJC5_DIPCM|nr:hypothetical protein O6H91_06G129500 [Diphasiastrum complanatum]